MHEYFDHVENGQVIQQNIRRGSKFQGRNLGKESPDAVYKLLFNLWPRVGEAPSYNPATQTRQEIERLVDTENEVSIRQWLVEDITEADLEKRKLAELAKLRWEKETAGIILNGVTIGTDREDQAIITGAYSAVQINPNRVINWKGSDNWVQLDAAAMTAIATAVADYVQACFTREKELAELIKTDINTDITTGWPSRS